jgi:predicted metalloprotease with PDZ domain
LFIDPAINVTTAASGSVFCRVEVVPARHELRVTMTITDPAAEGVLHVESPTWVPGDYSFQTFGRDVFDVEALDAGTGVQLQVRRSGWQGYDIEGASGSVVIRYTVYCSSWDRSEACGILGDTSGVLTGARYLRVPAYAGAYDVNYELPPAWAIHHPSGAVQLADSTWRYPSYEILLDTPVCIGAFDLVGREVSGTAFHYVFLDRAIGSEPQVEAFVERVDATVQTFYDMFGSFPFADYTFVCSLNPNAEWGLEHLTSTMVGLGPDLFSNPDQHAVGVRVCAHEFFHAWNVRRLRPAPLNDLDFERGSFTDGLWVAEGFTRYYEFLSCTRAGVYSPEQFLSAVVNYYRHLVALPAYRRVSPIDSSLATFLNHDDKYPGRVNDAIDYYDAGMVIAFGIDATLRSQTPDASLDSAFSAFYHRFVGRRPGYTPEDLRDFLEGVHVGVGEQAYCEASKAGALSLVDHLHMLGFDVGFETVPYIGLVLLNDAGPAIYGVLDTSPAADSGIAPEDVITSVNGYRFELNGLLWAIAHESVVRIDVVRGNQSRSYEIQVGHRDQIGRLSWAGNDQQAKRIAAWTRQEFAPAKGVQMSLEFYENFHGVETVI